MIIDVFSDTVCPWCFVGKRQLERAVDAWQGPPPEIRWRAFQLTPGMPAEGMPRDEYLQRKFGTADSGPLFGRVRDAGREVGIAFAFERIPRSPNTLDSHRLIRRAAALDRQDVMVEVLFRGYFLDGRDIGDRDELARLAGEAGLDPATTRDWLETREDVQAVRDEDAEARELGVSGVPFYVISRRYAVSGAQPPEVLLQAFARAEGAGA